MDAGAPASRPTSSVLYGNALSVLREDIDIVELTKMDARNGSMRPECQGPGRYRIVHNKKLSYSAG